MLVELAQKRLNQLRLLQGGLGLVSNPRNLKGITRLADSMINEATPEQLERFAEELCRSPQAVRALEKRYRVDPRDFDSHRKRAKGTLGRAYLAHLEKSEITPESLSPGPVSDDLSYVVAHLYETHDIWHAVTGFSASIPDELGLAAFGAAQLPSQFEYLLLAGGLLNTVFFEFEDRRPRMDAITRGWEMGKKARPLFGTQWGKLWDVPLTEVRRRLKVKTA